jgi:hypothetical protein
VSEDDDFPHPNSKSRSNGEINFGCMGGLSEEGEKTTIAAASWLLIQFITNFSIKYEFFIKT